MGPSVKFVSAIKDAISIKKNGQFFWEKDQTGGGGVQSVSEFWHFFDWIYNRVFFNWSSPKVFFR